MSKTFRQYDSRWGKKNYNGSSTMAAAGCGPTSCADIIYNMDTSITPWKTAKWMKDHGYAVRNHGTAWAGIPACLKAYGCQDVKNPQPMSEVYKIMKEDGYCAVFLFDSGSKGGVTWTTSGHFLACTDYKVKDGKHYFYMRDPGQRKHDGWYCYEKTMKGLILEIWTCYCPKLNGKLRNKETKTPKADLIVKLAKEYAYVYGTASSRCGYAKGSPKEAYKKALDNAYPDRSGWGKATRLGASCDVFVGTVVRNAGIDPKFARGLGTDKQGQWHDFANKDNWQEVKLTEVKAGDIIIYTKSGGGGHVCICLGDRVAEAGHENFYPVVKGLTKTRTSKSGKSKIKAFRVKEDY